MQHSWFGSGTSPNGPANDSGDTSESAAQSLGQRLDDAPSAAPTLNKAKQDKHVPGTNNYAPEGTRSILTDPDPQALLRQGAGKGVSINGIRAGAAGAKERVDFGRIIGSHVDPKTRVVTPTSKGMIIYDSKGTAHIVPLRP